jgi:hypothetical protein
MVQKQNKDSHRSTYSGGVKAVETSKWGADKARERYGSLQYDNSPPPAAKDATYPQFRQDQCSDKSYNAVAKDWRLGFGKGSNEFAEGKPGYVKGYRGK